MPDYKSFSDEQLKQAYFQHKDDTDQHELKAIVGAAIHRDLFLDVDSEDILTPKERVAANNDEQITRNLGHLQIYKAEAEKRGLKI